MKVRLLEVSKILRLHLPSPSLLPFSLSLLVGVIFRPCKCCYNPFLSLRTYTSLDLSLSVLWLLYSPTSSTTLFCLSILSSVCEFGSILSFLIFAFPSFFFLASPLRLHTFFSFPLCPGNRLRLLSDLWLVDHGLKTRRVLLYLPSNFPGRTVRPRFSFCIVRVTLRVHLCLSSSAPQCSLDWRPRQERTGGRTHMLCVRANFGANFALPFLEDVDPLETTVVNRLIPFYNGMSRDTEPGWRTSNFLPNYSFFSSVVLGLIIKKRVYSTYCHRQRSCELVILTLCFWL